MSYRYLVIGTGVGKAIARWLTEQKDTQEVSLVDAALEPAQRAVKDLARITDNREVLRSGCINAEEDEDYFVPIFRCFDVVISAVPARFNPKLARAAIRARTHFCDLGGVIPVTRDILELDDEADRACISIIPDCGLMPGLGNVMSQYLLDYLLPAIPETISIGAGALPQKNRKNRRTTSSPSRQKVSNTSFTTKCRSSIMV